MSDLLFAFLGSALFWLTIAGIAIRSLKLDFQQLESMLKRVYATLDSFSFHILPISRASLNAILTSIYGSSLPRRFLITLVSCFSIYFYMVRSSWIFWLNNKPVIENAILQATWNVDKDYYSAIQSSYDRMRYALELDFNTETYSNNDDESVRLRKLYEEFKPRYDRYIATHALGYYDLLDRAFGQVYGDPKFIGGHPLEVWAILVPLQFLAMVVIDFAANCAGIELFQRITANNLKKVSIIIVAVLIYYGLLLTNYLAILSGHEAFLPMILLITVLGGLGWIAALFNKIVTDEDRASKTEINWLKAVGIVGAVILAFLLVRDVVPDVVIGITNHVDLRGIMMVTITIFPECLMMSIVITITALKMIWEPDKTIVLGQIYGVAIIAGGTFCIGFLTTVLSCVAAIVGIWKILP